MAYSFWKFGTIVLPVYNRQTKMTPVRPRTATVPTAAGVFDAWGADRAPGKFPHPLSLSCTLVADDAATWRSQVDALRAAVGTRAILYRVADDDGAVQKCTARLVDMTFTRVGRLARHQEMTLVFEQIDQWRGKRWEDWTLDDGYFLDDGMYFDTGAVALTALGSMTVGGNLPALDVRVTVTVGAVAPTADLMQVYVLADPQCVVTLADTYAPGDVYYIDSAARLATKNGADAYALIDLETEYVVGEYHEANEWLILPPGSLSLGLAYEGDPGASATGVLEFTEAWA